MKKIYFATLFCLFVLTSIVKAQDTTNVSAPTPSVEIVPDPATEEAGLKVEITLDSVTGVEDESAEPERPWAISLSTQKGYIWRGQPLGLPDHLAIQPGFTYTVTPELSLSFWMTTNLNNNNPQQGYDEYDIAISYTVSDLVTVGLASYYFPPVELAKGEEAPSFTDFSGEGVQTLDATIIFDLNTKNIPATILWSTFIAGADVDDEDNRQFTSYVEATYTIEKFGLTIAPTVGALVFGNKSAYYSFAKEGFNLVNIGAKISKDLSENLSFLNKNPILEKISKSGWVSITYNPQINEDNETSYGSSDASKVRGLLISVGLQLEF